MPQKSVPACSMLLWNTMAFIIVIFVIYFVLGNRLEREVKRNVVKSEE